MPEEKIAPVLSKERIPATVPDVAPTPVERRVSRDPAREHDGVDAEEIGTEDDEQSETATPIPASRVAQTVAPTPPKDKQLAAIERVLEEDLGDVFWEMTPAAQEAFKKKGEETAHAIDKLLQQVHVQVVKILKLIKQWLALIPHVNRFFLEQEAKIKTDKLIALAGKRDE